MKYDICSEFTVKLNTFFLCVCVVLETKNPGSIWNVMIVSLWNSWLFQNGHKSHFVKYDGEITSEFCFDFCFKTENKMYCFPYHADSHPNYQYSNGP